MFTNTHQSENSCILAQIYAFSTPEEKNFWRRVRDCLVTAGMELIVLCHSEVHEHIDYGVSVFSMRFLVDKFADYGFLPDDLRMRKVSSLLERERSWSGAGDDEQRAGQISYISLVYQHLCLSINPALVLVGNGEHVVDLILKESCEKRQIPLVYHERGPFPFSYQLDLFGVTANTSAAKRTDCYWVGGDKTDRIKTFIEYENVYRTQKQTWWEQPTFFGSLRSYFAVPDSKKIILFANQIDQDTSCFLNAPLHKTNLEAFKWFCDQLALYKDEYFVVGKHHPKNKTAKEPFAEVVSGLGVWTDEIPLDVCLRDADLVACVNSTIMYEALIMRKPVLMLGKAILSGKDIAYEISGLSQEIDSDTIKAWIDAYEISQRMQRWEELGASLIADCLYFYNETGDRHEYQGCTEFCQKLLNHINDRGSPNQLNPFGYAILIKIDEEINRLQKENRLLHKTVYRLQNAFPCRLWKIVNQLFHKLMNQSGTS